MSTVLGQLALLLVISFLLGSIPGGVIISRVFYHTDLREHASGNIGTTNAIRSRFWQGHRCRAYCRGIRHPGASWQCACRCGIRSNVWRFA